MKHYKLVDILSKFRTTPLQKPKPAYCRFSGDGSADQFCRLSGFSVSNFLSPFAGVVAIISVPTIRKN